MGKTRVYELARELKLGSREVVEKLNGIGISVAGHQSTLTEDQLKKARGALGQKEASPLPKKPVVIRRRKKADSLPEPESAVEVQNPKNQTTSDTLVVEAKLEEPVPPAATEKNHESKAEELAGLKKGVETDATAQSRSHGMPADLSEDPGALRPTERQLSGPSEVDSEEVSGTVNAESSQQHSPSSAAKETDSDPERDSKGSVSSSQETTKEEGVRAEPEEPTKAGSSGEISRPSAPGGDEKIEKLKGAEEKVGGGMLSKDRFTSAKIVRRAPQTPDRSRSFPGSVGTHGGARSTVSTRDSRRAPMSSRSGGGGTAGEGRPNRPDEAFPSSDFAGQRGPARGRGRGGKDVKGREEAESAELKQKAASAKARRGSVLSSRALLSSIDAESDGAEEVVAPVRSSRVYTPSASARRREGRRKKDMRKTVITTPRAQYRVVKMTDSIQVSELAKQLSVKAGEVIKKLMAQGVMVGINGHVDFETAGIIASDYDFEVKNEAKSLDDILEVNEQDGKRDSRPPIVTVMGHVDHGKTSILDTIRSTSVVAKEAGGITQHIGAYTVEKNDRRLAFLDTPGHEAFSTMRSRGASLTDIVVLVVAADDGVMPQTKEAISHARAADVPLIVAINKIDKPNKNIERIYTELSELGVQPEDWGGDVQFVQVSALENIGIDDLLEAVLLQAEVMELEARVEGLAQGTVIEAHLDKGRGPVATIMVQHGQLHRGEYVVAGGCFGRVRDMTDHLGRRQKEAGPSTPVQIVGLSQVPSAGDGFSVAKSEKAARDAADWHLDQLRTEGGETAKMTPSSIEDFLGKVSRSEVPTVPLIIKGDTQGSVEAIKEAVEKLNNDRVTVKVIHRGVGGISESDMALTQASDAVILGFNVRAERSLTEKHGNDDLPIRYFSIIYDLVDAVKALMAGKLPPVLNEVVQGHAEVRNPISVPKIGLIAGSAVLDGKITRNCKLRLIRDNVVIYDGKLGSLRRFKDDVREVQQGYECGISIEGFQDIREGDVIEAYIVEETQATL